MRRGPEDLKIKTPRAESNPAISSERKGPVQEVHGAHNLELEAARLTLRLYSSVSKPGFR